MRHVSERVLQKPSLERNSRLGALIMPFSRRLASTGMAALLAAALMPSSQSEAQSLGEPAAGKRLAMDWCIQCHRIEREHSDSNRTPPDFGAVANMPSFTELAMWVFLQTPHGQMPRYQFSRSEIDDLVAYLASLRGR
jgi:mono/diheme cytochrome c family protein